MVRDALSVEPLDLATLLVSSVRYALGRRTYIVSDTVALVRKYERALSEQARLVMISDISGCAFLGDDCDRSEWHMLLEHLRGGVLRVGEEGGSGGR